MENSGDSGDETGPQGGTSYFTSGAVAGNYIGVQSDDLEGMYYFLIRRREF